ncbi:MAG: HAD hydrolase family protein [Candidatus Micrarchaeota archaeon]|nr:HAD hydrolase family protein [Candidatus Micrarchaeota archaeon]
MGSKSVKLLVVFDFDETIAEPRSISVIGDIINKRKHLESLLINSDPKERFILIANELLGYESSILSKAAEKMHLIPYVKELIYKFRELDSKIGILSDGYLDLINHFIKVNDLCFDFVYAHSFVLSDNKLKEVLPVYGKYSPNDWKGRLLTDLKSKFNADISVAIGDNLQDISMLKSADISIAYNPKDEKVSKSAKFVVSSYKDVVDKFHEYFPLEKR